MRFLKIFRRPAQNLGAMGYWVPVSLYPFVTSISADPDTTVPLVQVLSDWARTLKCFMLCSILVQPRNTDINEKLLTGMLSTTQIKKLYPCWKSFSFVAVTSQTTEFTSHLLKRKKKCKDLF